MSEVNNSEHVNESYSFKWGDYQNHLSGVVRQLLEENCMVDVTLSAAGERIHAHRIVLCACSTLFKELLSHVTEDHPTIILSGISAEDVRAIVEFTYQGEAHVPEENIRNLLEAARFLKITGLMEYDVNESSAKSRDSSEENVDSFTESNEMEEEVLDVLEQPYDETNEHSEQSATEESAGVKKRKRRFPMKREYSEDMLTAAINNLREGQTLIEASTKNNIPRSTLYMRAKALGIQLNASRNEYPAECMRAAINSVIGGSSLQQASEMFGIPKTVLWRRMQKEGYHIFRSEMKRSYGSDKREAAVEALQRGENLTKVAQQYQIPKTTLFRDKARLVDEGKLPTSFWKKRKTENESIKKFRLEEAVAACKSGKMSQAAASVLYHIPKTTIWRRLQQHNSKIKSKIDSADPLSSLQDNIESDAQFTYCEVASEIPVTYTIEDNGISGEQQVIVFTPEEVEGLNLDARTQIIISSDSNQEFVTNSTTVEDDTDYSSNKS